MIEDQKDHPTCPWHNLPPRPPSDPRWESLIATILQRLEPESRHWIVALEDDGEIGGRIALEVCWRLVSEHQRLLPAERYHAILWMNPPCAPPDAALSPSAATIALLRELSQRIATVLHSSTAPLPADDDQLVPQILERLRAPRRMLLVVNRCEQLDEFPMQDLLHQLPRPAKALVTTRRRGEFPFALRVASDAA